ncbi:glycosyltransferase [Rudaea cellulosilytica]|uniref:glycosyltransferase n=1 Tax=Rudaea cellulosilytica TaxID=540746 RepID=UPI0003783E43|nr:glycosyltransferase [Rudaea cellulosilytica]
MFFIDTPPRDYSDPWSEDFWSRFATFRKGSHRVAYFYEKADNSTFRYRAYNMVQTLADSTSDVSAGYFFPSDGSGRIDSVLKLADTVVLCRMRYDANISHIVARARSMGKTVLYDVDDLVFDTDLTHLILGTLAQDFKHPGVWDHWFAYISRIGTTLRMCDAAITTNPFLARRITEFSGKPVFIVPNYMNRQQLEFSAALYEDKRARAFQRNGRCHIGYFSGTPTHKRDFDLAVPALASLLERYDHARLFIVGYLSLPPMLERFKDRTEIYPLHDFVNLQRIISLVEINVVPLVDNVFTNCKSELKYFEAAAVGCLTVASPTSTYSAAIEPGVNGWLSSSLEWESVLENAIGDFDKHLDMMQATRDKAVGAYSGSAMLNAILAAVTWRR